MFSAPINIRHDEIIQIVNNDVTRPRLPKQRHDIVRDSAYSGSVSAGHGRSNVANSVTLLIGSKQQMLHKGRFVLDPVLGSKIMFYIRIKNLFVCSELQKFHHEPSLAKTRQSVDKSMTVFGTLSVIP